jgi:hypothetical protein
MPINFMETNGLRLRSFCQAGNVILSLVSVAYLSLGISIYISPSHLFVNCIHTWQLTKQIRSAGVLQYGQLNQKSLAQHYEEESGPGHSHRSSIKSFGCIPSTSGFNQPHKFSGSIGIFSEYGGEGWSVK